LYRASDTAESKDLWASGFVGLPGRRCDLQTTETLCSAGKAGCFPAPCDTGRVLLPKRTFGNIHRLLRADALFDSKALQE